MNNFKLPIVIIAVFFFGSVVNVGVDRLSERVGLSNQNMVAVAEAGTVSGSMEDFALGFYQTISSLFDKPEDKVYVIEKEISEKTITEKNSVQTKEETKEILKQETQPLTQTTVVNPIRERTIETRVERVVSGVTLADLQQLNNELRAEIYRLADSVNVQTQNTYRTISLTNKIDNLASITLSDSTITGGTISGATISNSSFSGSSLSLSGALTTTGQLTVSGTATSTMAGDFAFDSNTLYIDSLNNRIGIGTTSPSDTLALNGAMYLAPISAPSDTANRLYNISDDLYWAGNLIGGATSANWTLSGSDAYRLTGNVGIGTTSPTYRLSVEGDINIDQYSGYKQAGNTILYASSTNSSTLVGIGAGSSMLSNGAYNTALGKNSLYLNTSGSQNTASGYQSLRSNTTGSQNTASGYHSLYSNISGLYNTAVGNISLYSNTSGHNNAAFGSDSMYSNTSGGYNAAIGRLSLHSNTVGTNNTASGANSLYSNTSGSYNTADGSNAGRYTSTGALNQTSGYSLYLGANTRALASGDTNEIVIGYNTIGVGSNSVVLGNDSITKTILKGSIGIGTTTPWRTLSVNGTAAFTSLTNDGTGYYACVNASSGELATSTTACGASSERFKEEIETLSYGLDTILLLNPVSFEWKKDFIPNGTKQIGFIAEEVEEIIPEVIGYDDEGRVMNLDYPKLTAVLVNAIKELVTTIDEKISNAIASISELVADRIVIKQEICIGNTCINENQLIALLANSGFNMEQTSLETTAISDGLPLTKSTIIIQGNNPALIELNSTYIDMGVIAQDSEGNDLSVKASIFASDNTIIQEEISVNSISLDTSTSTTYIITYTTTDNNGITVSEEREVTIGSGGLSSGSEADGGETSGDISTTTPEVIADTTIPTITLTGSETIEIELNETYTDQGATANDNTDGDITANITTNNPTDTTTAGTYTITYNVTDTAENPAIEVTRTVIVKEA
ncbi:DUF5011 domain-containing protein, partial [Patescibacteria group bacterium]|nr:DUF5011 domain-containing protein [Patescibacteria group bacterium]